MVKIKFGGRLLILMNCPLFILFACYMIFLSGCSPKAAVSDTPDENTTALGDILVMPFKDMYKIYGTDITFRCPLCGAVHMTGKVEDGADEFLTDQLFSLLRQRPALQLIGSGQAEGAKNQVLSKAGKELSEIELILETARNTGAESVLVGRVFRFIPRVGTSYSVEMPASVSFDLILLRVSDGQLIWSGKFDETQRALNENLFQLGTFLKRKARWLTARELALSGLNDVLGTFPEPL